MGAAAYHAIYGGQWRGTDRGGLGRRGPLVRAEENDAERGKDGEERQVELRTMG